MRNQFIIHALEGLNSVFAHFDESFSSALEDAGCKAQDSMKSFNSLLTAYTKNNKNPDEYDDAPFYVHWKDMSGKYIACNDRVAQDVGLKMDTMLGLTDFNFEFISRKQMLTYRKHDAIVRETEKPQFFIEPVTLPSGEVVATLSHKSPLRLRSKKMIGTKCLAFVLNNNENVLSKLSCDAPENNSPTLTTRQLDCLFHLVKGMTVKQIAVTLHLSPKTIEHYLEAIKSKLNCYSRSELIQKALKIDKIRNRL